MAGQGKYKETLNLPQTDFPMRGNLAKREPEILARWEQENLYQALMEARSGAPRYLLHDGPPYANGHIHYGHILNKILKDLVLKSRSMAGYACPYVPGWDTHGLPIENEVERDLGKRRRDLSASEFRSHCREYALKFVDIQRNEFKRLGILGDWDRPYLTLHKSYESSIVRALAAFARGGYFYRGKKPVYWCPTHRTALAEAEIEYHEHTSPSIYVRFPLDSSFDVASLTAEAAGKSISLVIWTTTPWTLFVNLAIVGDRGFDYVLIPNPNDATELLMVAKALAPTFLADCGMEVSEADWIAIDKENLGQLEGVGYRHPFIDQRRGDNDFKFWFVDYVTLDQGTGLVHTAPGHGVDDYKTGLAHGLEVYAPVDDAGRFTDDVPRWRGKKAFAANPEIVAYLDEIGALLSPAGLSLTHSYPHSWRSKKPVLFRATDQWFISIDHEKLRQRALDAIDETTWIPAWGRNRIHGMIENRPDWVLSRQRLWGVPIPAFYCEGCGHLSATADLMDHIADLFHEHGADHWFEKEAAELLPPGFSCPGCSKTTFRKESAIVDVWFESGVSWLAVCKNNPELGDIDLYLEGSDQHRGWFHSSLLIGLGVVDKAPYKSVLTHGFVLDEDGHPYSKSRIAAARAAGKKIKYVDPKEFIAKNGAELFRLWTASTEFRNDIPYSDAIIKNLTDWYRKFRNTSRFLLGNLGGFDPNAEPPADSELSDIDRYALARIRHLAAQVRGAYERFEFHVAYKGIVDYVAGDLSALYLDVVKDSLYSDPVGAVRRRSIQFVIYEIARTLALLTAPILCFTAEDLWTHLPKRQGDPKSVHLALLPDGVEFDESSNLASRWQVFLRYRELATKQLEAFRALKHRSEDAHAIITASADDLDVLRGQEALLSALLIVSAVTVADEAGEPAVAIEQAAGSRCERCWRYYETMSESDPAICVRCQEAVADGAAS